MSIQHLPYTHVSAWHEYPPPTQHTCIDMASVSTTYSTHMYRHGISIYHLPYTHVSTWHQDLPPTLHTCIDMASGSTTCPTHMYQHGISIYHLPYTHVSERCHRPLCNCTHNCSVIRCSSLNRLTLGLFNKLYTKVKLLNFENTE